MRVVRQSPATLTWQPVDSEGEPVAATGTPTVEITRASGGTLTPAGSPSLSDGVVSLPLTAAELADVDRLTVTWSLDDVERGVSTVDVVGGVYLTVAEIRTIEPSLSDPGQYPAAVLQRCRREVESRFERAVNTVAFVPRLSTHRFTGRGTAGLILPHYYVTEVRWARYWSNAAWTSLTLVGASSTIEGAIDIGTSPFPCGFEAEVGYVHGMASPPDDVKRAAALAVRYQAMQNQSGLDSRAMSYQPSEGGNVVLATAGVGPWEFGVPDIDVVLRSWRDRYPLALVA